MRGQRARTTVSPDDDEDSVRTTNQPYHRASSTSAAT
jgi:hypothetical protein